MHGSKKRKRQRESAHWRLYQGAERGEGIESDRACLHQWVEHYLNLKVGERAQVGVHGDNRGEVGEKPKSTNGDNFQDAGYGNTARTEYWAWWLRY